MTTLWTDGSWIRCARCGWLHAAREALCAQCGRERPLPAHDHVERAELAVVYEPIELRAVEVRTMLAMVRALAAQPPLSDETRALAAMGGRAILLAPTRAAFATHAARIAAELAATRGELSVFSPAISLADAASIRVVSRAQDASLALIDAPLATSRAQREALREVPWLLVAATDALSRSLASLHELLALVRPELAETHRAFTARFGRVDRDGATLDDSALASRLARATIRVEPSTPLEPSLAPLERWLASAPRS